MTASCHARIRSIKSLWIGVVRNCSTKFCVRKCRFFAIQAFLWNIGFTQACQALLALIQWDGALAGENPTSIRLVLMWDSQHPNLRQKPSLTHPWQTAQVGAKGKSLSLKAAPKRRGRQALLGLVLGFFTAAVPEASSCLQGHPLHPLWGGLGPAAKPLGAGWGERCILGSNTCPAGAQETVLRRTQVWT